MVNTDVMQELGRHTGLPLLASIILLCSGGGVSVFLGFYYLYKKSRGQVATTSFVRDALSKFDWPLWVLITAVLFLITNHLLVRGSAVGIWDVDGQFYPFQVLVADYARAGRFINWDPWSNAGRPILADPQVGAFSPVNFIIGLLGGGGSFGFLLYWLLMWWLGGFGMLMLARHLKAPPWGGCVVALGFLFSGVYTGNAEHTPWIACFSFLPLIIWRLDVALCSRKLWPAIEAGALWGLSALAGYPAVTIITGCFSALWALGRYLFAESSGIENVPDTRDSAANIRERPRIGFVVLALALELVVGLVVLSPTYIAFFFEGAGTIARVDPLTRERVTLSNALHPGALSTFASPYLTVVKFNDQMNGENTLWPYTDVSSVSIYAGAIISVLAVFALLRRPRHGWRWSVIALGALSLACALAQALPLRGWLYDWFYPMRFFRNAAIFRFYYLFAISVLALIGTRDLAIAVRHPADRTWRQFVTASLCTSVAALLVFVVFATSGFETTKIILLLGYVHALWVWLGICCIAFCGCILPNRLRQWCVPILLLALAGSDAFLTSTLSRQTMIDTRPSYVQRWATLDENHSPILDLTSNGLSREHTSCYPNPPCRTLKNDQLITKVPVFNSYTNGENYFHQEMAGHAILKRIALGSDRLWFSKDASQVGLTEANFVSFVNRTEKLGVPPLLVHSPEELLRSASPPKRVEHWPMDGSPWTKASGHEVAQIEELPAAKRIAVDLMRYLPDELAFTVQCPTDGWLLVTDRWARSWRAEVNGKQTTVYGGNFIFRAVQVAAGQNSVRFTYHPFGFPWLVIMSWGTLATVAICSVYGGFCSGKSSQPNRT